MPVFWSGYTIGKRICGIRIRRVDDHLPPSLGTMLLRNVVAGIVYALTLGIGVIISAFMVAFREDKRSIHDFIATSNALDVEIQNVTRKDDYLMLSTTQKGIGWGFHDQLAELFYSHVSDYEEE